MQDRVLEELSAIISIPKEELAKFLDILKTSKQCKVVFESSNFKATLEKSSWTDYKLQIRAERRFNFET